MELKQGTPVPPATGRVESAKGCSNLESAPVLRDRNLVAIVRGATVKMAKKHPGFKSVQSSIAKCSGVGKERAGAILAAATRRASPAAKKFNPRLKRVRG